METKLTDEIFDKEIKTIDKFVVVDFFATWCEPCSLLAPILEKTVEQFKEKVVLMKANLEDIPFTAQKFGVERIPTVVIFKNGKPVSGFVGLMAEPAIREWIENAIKESGQGQSPASAEDGKAKQEKIEELKKEFSNYAKENGFKLNPDEKIVERIINGLLENEKKYGEKYCPCRRVSGNKDEDAKKICPCIWHKDEIEKDGHCFCNLYVKI